MMKKSYLVIFLVMVFFIADCGQKKKAPIEPPSAPPPTAPTQPEEPKPSSPPGEAKPSQPTKPALPAPPPKPRAPSPGDTASNKLVESGVKKMNAGALPDAEDLFTQALRVSPNNGRPYYYMGVLAAKQNDCERALEFLEQAEVHLKGDAFWLSQVFMQEGLCYKTLKKTDLARKKFQQAVQQDPTNAAAQKELKALKP
jgi:TolA-binding protein